MLEPIIKKIQVPCDLQMAFEVFVHQMHLWWPLEQFSVSAKHRQQARGLEVEAKLGGRITETSIDGSTHLWGTFIAFDPYNSFSLDFHIGEPKESASLLEVYFTPLEAALTQVELKQSRWEAFGKKAQMMRGGYDAGWLVIFDQGYKNACFSPASTKE